MNRESNSDAQIDAWIYLRSGVMHFDSAHSIGGQFLVYVNGLPAHEVDYWNLWSSCELHLPEGLHEISFVREREEGETAGLFVIDNFRYTEVNDP